MYDHEKFTPADILQKIHDYHITSLCAPPTIYRFLIREDLSKFDLSSLEYCTTAGEALNYSVYETFKKITGIRLMEGFGQTETALTLATFPWMDPKPGSMGVPNPQYDIDLLTPDGRSAEDGEQGQIVVRTDKGKPLGLFKEYYRDAELTREAWHDGIYYTGDVAWRDEDGYYWFVGRADDRLVETTNMEIVEVNQEIAKKAAQIRAEYKGFKAMDAIQLAVACLTKCDLFLTNDKQLRQFKEIKCITVDELE